MLEKSRNAVFSRWSVCRVSPNVGLLKRRVRSHVVRGEIKNCTPLWRKAHFQVEMHKTWGVRSTFVSSDVEKMHAAVARQTCGSENVKKKKGGLGALFEVQMSKKCTQLWWNVHLEVTMLKNWGSGSTFWSSDVDKMHAAVAKSTFWSENVQNVWGSEHFLRFWCRNIARRCSAKHICKWKCTEYLCFSTLFELQMSKNLSLSKFFSQSISQVVN